VLKFLGQEDISRREPLRQALGASALLFSGTTMAAPSILRRPIPRTKESFNAITYAKNVFVVDHDIDIFDDRQM